MGEKLTQMNGVIQNVVSKLDEDTILFVFGDHGMTETGDHGGDSKDELNAGLFVYSKGRSFNQTPDQRGRQIHQIDLVPTLSLLLDFPVPFSSLGAVISELFQHSSMKAVTEANAWQVVRYTENYKKYLSDNRITQSLDRILRQFHESNPKEMAPEDYLRTIEDIRAIFEESWAQFHPEWMLIGVMTVLENLLWSFLLLRGQLGGRRLLVKVLGSFPLMTVAVIGEKESVPSFVGILVCLQVTWNLYGLANDLIIKKPLGYPPISRLFPIAIILLSCAAVFSNSFLVHEDATIRFLLLSLIMFCGFLKAPTKSAVSMGKLKRKLGANPGWSPIFRNYISLKVTFGVILGAVAVRLGAGFNRCREEQGPGCVPSPFTLQFASLPEDSVKSTRYGIAILSLITVALMFSRFFAFNGHSQGYNALTIMNRIVATITPLLIGGFWTCQWLPEIALERFKTLVQVALPLSVYGIFILALTVYLWNPLLVFFLRSKERDHVPKSRWPNGMVDKKDVFNHVNENWQDYLRRENDKPGQIYVFGMVSAYSGSILAFLFPWTLLLILIVGDGIAPSLLLLIVAGVVILELNETDDANHDVLKMSENISAVWSLLAVHSFYSFGHHATFSSIPWEAAFLGIPGNFQFQLAPASLVILNVNAGHILLGLALPLTYIWSHYRGKMGRLGIGPKESDASELEAATNSPAVAWNASVSYITYLALRLFAVTLCSAVHQRHLMVWKIFAPKFIFEGVSFIVSMIAILIGYFVFLRVDRVLKSLLQS